MSGHSHAKTVKRVKDAEDKKRGKAFSKIARVIIFAAKEGGGDPGSNYKLKMAIDQARQVNMPKENIERAIKKGTGELTGEKLEQFVFEAYGPEKTAIIIEGITDNKNRSLSEIKQILNQHNGKLAGAGSVKWLFERKGTITVNNEQKTINKEELELIVIEAGAEDIYWDDDALYIYTNPEELEKVKKNLEEKNIKIESSSLDWVAKKLIELEEKEKESCQKLFEALDENDAVQDIYSNLKI
ncbi:YebC/PmpR family DNA-binding transcriptional regulator [Patescibacteria group bacterium]|nr:YebC/PmpR family DNA-binding transcriptional regulator [Patescibacteria group bacterium]